MFKQFIYFLVPSHYTSLMVTTIESRQERFNQQHVNC